MKTLQIRWAVNGTATNVSPSYLYKQLYFWLVRTNRSDIPIDHHKCGSTGAGAGAGGRFVVVEVDGTILTDNRNGNSFESVGFSEFNELSKATGARPLLNTGNGGACRKTWSTWY